MQLIRRESRPAALAVLLLCAFAVNVDTTIVNVTLPTLSRELPASTRELQWIVDAYTLTFAAFVLAAGALGDRFGRRRLLALGLVVYLAGNAAAAFSDSSAALTGWRAVMGLGAALIFPATLSTIVHLFPERRARARAIGLWGATTGIAVALGPIVGGALLEASGWQAAFWLKVPLAAVALALVLAVVPESADPSRPRVDRLGLAISSLGVLALVFTIIEAPEQGWAAARTVAGFAIAASLLIAFVAYERRVPAPLLDVRLFRNPRFSAASAAITLAFFALFGFIFLITQYFQLLRGYAPLETGIRLLPVALSTGTAAVLGTTLAVRIGNKAVVATGLTLTAVMFAWTSQVDGSTPYAVIAAQMVLLGTGMGLTTAPATEALMGAVPRANAGVGSGVNDTTRELGGTLGVAVLGSVFASLYTAALGDLPSQAHEASKSVAAAFGIAAELGGARGDALRHLAANGFYDGFAAACLVAAGVSAIGASAAALFLPARPGLERTPTRKENTMKLTGKRILITGGGSGIGLELARRLAPANKVVIVGRDEGRLDRARAETPTLYTRRLDIRAEDEAQAAIAWLESELGGLDVLVNNAGSLRGYPLSAKDAAAKSIDDIDVNLVGALRMTRLALPLLAASGEGAVVFLSSAVALAAVPGFAVYAATKAAVHSLARSLRAELEPRGIRVFEVLPPVVDTGPMHDLDVPKLPPGAVADAIAAGIDQGREEIRVGRVRALAPLARILPGLADRIVVGALTPAAEQRRRLGGEKH